MKKNLFILFILVSMLFPGCENELPYMNKPQVPQLLMNAFLEAGKEENGVSLRMIDTDKQQADCVSNGSIVVYVNGQKTETAEVEKVYGSFDDSNCTLKTSFRPGDRIRFEATAEDGQYQAVQHGEWIERRECCRTRHLHAPRCECHGSGQERGESHGRNQ